MRSIIVTGANKGIGYGLVKHLAADSMVPSKIFLTSRDVNRGKQALEQVIKETKGSWASGTSIEYHQLDITNDLSINTFAKYISRKLSRPSIDVLINNAGVMHQGNDFNGDIAKATIDVNYFGTVKFTEHMLDFLNNNSRVVILSGILGKLRNVPKDLQTKYLSESLTMEQLSYIQNDYVQSAYEGKCKERGYTDQPYAFSKVAISAYARVLARRFSNDSRGIFVGSCHPGWIKTDMGGPKASHDVNYGVKTPLYLVNEDIEKLRPFNGQYFAKSKVENW